ncbi:MAG TPA: TonB-dependent receptor [Flavobacterium sp.]|jgi:iron complex outermembrane receptor protein
MKILLNYADGRAAGSAALRRRQAFGSTRYFASILHAGAASIVFLGFSGTLSAQEIPDSTKTKPVIIDEVMVKAVRAAEKTPVTFSNFSKKEIEQRNLGQDIPLLLNYLPSVVSTSDAGNGFGYTGIRVRGSDATRVNVTINGIPYNDSESSGTFFVDLPDFASSLENIQLQRGVGTSTNGAGAFGASLNLLTEKTSEKAGAEISNSVGSFNSRKHTLKFTTGLLNEHFEISGRLSVLHSDGYIDRATSDLKSYFLQGTYIGKSTMIKALVFGGKERTYQAWNGIDAETLATNPTFNFSGMYTDENGNTRFYENEVDDYSQDHFQLHWNEQFSDNWNTNLAFHYTIGKGYYENYKEDADFGEYGLTPVIAGGETISETDLVRRKWLDNDFYGMTFSANYNTEKLDFIVGGALNNYEGKHFGEVVWARFASASEPGDHYYDQNAQKSDFNVFTKANYQVGKRLNLFADLQLRLVDYHTVVDPARKVDENFTFFNPKAGLTFSISDASHIYFSYAHASKEPNRTDYENGRPKAEKLHDIEVGWRFNSGKFRISSNLYLMYYEDQLVKTGEIDEIGNEIRSNVDRSYRTGIEVDAMVQVTPKFSLSPNITVSQNKILDYTIMTETGMRNFGNTNISFSPALVSGLIASYRIADSFTVSLLNKYVGEQYAGNIDTEITKLDGYTVTDLNIVYEWRPRKIFSSILFTGLVNNVFDAEYVSNAYLYGENYLSYFPQAGINFLVGITLKL